VRPLDLLGACRCRRAAHGAALLAAALAVGCGGEGHATREALATVDHFVYLDGRGRPDRMLEIPRCVRAAGTAGDAVEVAAGARTIGHRLRGDTVFVHVEYTLLGSATLGERSTFRRDVRRDTLTFTVLNPRPGSPAIVCRPHATRRLSHDVLHPYVATFDAASHDQWLTAVEQLPAWPSDS